MTGRQAGRLVSRGQRVDITSWLQGAVRSQLLEPAGVDKSLAGSRERWGKLDSRVNIQLNCYRIEANA